MILCSPLNQNFEFTLLFCLKCVFGSLYSIVQTYWPESIVTDTHTFNYDHICVLGVSGYSHYWPATATLQSYQPFILSIAAIVRKGKLTHCVWNRDKTKNMHLDAVVAVLLGKYHVTANIQKRLTSMYTNVEDLINWCNQKQTQHNIYFLTNQK